VVRHSPPRIPSFKLDRSAQATCMARTLSLQGQGRNLASEFQWFWCLEDWQQNELLGQIRLMYLEPDVKARILK
jgi:hypothetical protein